MTKRLDRLFPESFFHITDAQLTSFERVGTNQYKFHYRYSATYEKLQHTQVEGYFIVDTNANIEKVQITDDLRIAQLEDALVKASAPDIENDLEVMNSVLVELKTQAIAVTGDFLKLFERNPSEEVQGTGIIPCKNSSNRLIKINGSIFRDQIECSFGD